MTVPEADRRRIEALLTAYVRCVDDDRLEDWPELFAPGGLYRIITRENFAQGMALPIMECRGHGMMRDRVTGLRRVNVYEPQRYLHHLSALAIEAVEPGVARCRSNYLVTRTTLDGSLTLFSAGLYLDRVDLAGERALFRERVVVTESRRVDTLLVIPL